MSVPESRHRNRSDLRRGAVLLAVGIWLLVSTLEIGGLDYSTSWPLMMILIGLALSFVPRRSEGCHSGLALIVWGSLAWIAVHNLWGLGWGSIWPLALVAVGLCIVWEALRGRKAPESVDSSGGAR